MNKEFKVRHVTLELLGSNTSDEERKRMLVGEKLYTGKMFLGPSVGKSFSFYRDDGEYMHTSTVKNIEYIHSNAFKLTTLNSVYFLKIGDVVE